MNATQSEDVTWGEGPARQAWASRWWEQERQDWVKISKSQNGKVARVPNFVIGWAEVDTRSGHGGSRRRVMCRTY